jgi:hypothetical protein
MVGKEVVSKGIASMILEKNIPENQSKKTPPVKPIIIDNIKSILRRY